MASVIREAVIDAPPSHCWEALRDFSALHERLGAIKQTLEERELSGRGRHGEQLVDEDAP
jgi:hypothetical protein